MSKSGSESTTGPSVARPARVRRPRRWVPYLGAVLLIGLIVAGLWPRPTPVETARVSTGKLQATVNEEGRTRVKQRYVVSAPVTGQLRRITLKPGAEVKASSTTLAVIEPLAPALLDPRSRVQAEAKRDAARANLEKMKTAHEFASSELRRFEKLFREKAISVQELEPIQWREAAASRETATAESAVRQAEAELAEFAPNEGGTPVCRTPTEVKSPASGAVLRVLQESSRVVTAGTALVEVGDPTDLEVVVEVLSRDGASISPGARVELEQWGGGPPLEGRVRLVEPAAFTKVSALGVEEQRVNVIADIVTPAEQRRTLGDSFRVEARIVIWSADDALKVPSGALFRRGQEWAAYVLHSARVELRTVRAGRSSGTETQVLDGLNDGDEVILYPGDRVREGEHVRPVKI